MDQYLAVTRVDVNNINLQLKTLSSPEIQIKWQTLDNGSILILCNNYFYYF